MNFWRAMAGRGDDCEDWYDELLPPLSPVIARTTPETCASVISA